MLDPALAFQTAVRAALVASPKVVALVHPDMIRASATRPERMPSVILADVQT